MGEFGCNDLFRINKRRLLPRSYFLDFYSCFDLYVKNCVFSEIR